MHQIIIHQVEQGSLEWFNLRVGMVTASKFSDIIKNGKNGQESQCRLTLIETLTAEILINKKLDFGQSFSMKQGIEREPLAKIAYEQKTFNRVDRVGLIQIEDYYIGCSPDGLINDNGGIEIKCPEPKKHLEYLKSETMPSEYIAQVQGCMWVSNRKYWDFVSYNPDFPEHLQLKIIRVNRDEEVIAKIAKNAYEVEQAVRNQVSKLLRV
jgi:putative phage-type endonuclease